jgi:hypothetical protein
VNLDPSDLQQEGEASKEVLDCLFDGLAHSDEDNFYLRGKSKVAELEMVLKKQKEKRTRSVYRDKLFPWNLIILLEADRLFQVVVLSHRFLEERRTQPIYEVTLSLGSLLAEGECLIASAQLNKIIKHAVGVLGSKKYSKLHGSISNLEVSTKITFEKTPYMLSDNKRKACLELYEGAIVTLGVRVNGMKYTTTELTGRNMLAPKVFDIETV